MKIHALAIATAVATFALLLIGGAVNPTGSSLACPDWPTCYGSFFPEMTGGVLFEHSHRIVATLVGALCVVLAVSVWRACKEDRAARRLVVAAVALVIFQGVLGGVTVLLRLPTAVSTMHLAMAMVFFGLTIFLCFRLRPGARRGRVAVPSVRKLAAVGAVAVYVQILLGALVRHTGAGRSCLELGSCEGELFPAWGPAALHMIHRYVGLAVFLLVIALAVAALRALRGRDRALARLTAAVVPWVAGLQVGVGFLMIARRIEWVSAMAHTGVAALLWACFVMLFVASGPLADPAILPSPQALPGGLRTQGGAA